MVQGELGSEGEVDWGGWSQGEVEATAGSPTQA